MIKVGINRNIVFFFFLFNLLSETKNIEHPLGKKLMEKFPKEPSDIGELRKQYASGEIPRNPYQYCTLAINTSKELKPLPLSPNYGYGVKTLESYSEKMYSAVLNIERELNFFEELSKEILPEYKLLCEENQKYLGKDVFNAIKNFWNLEEDIQLFLMPNILAKGGSFGLFRKKNNVLNY